MRKSAERFGFGDFLSNGDFLFLSNDETLFNPHVDFETQYLRERVFERQGESF